jgi:hypothetical protein
LLHNNNDGCFRGSQPEEVEKNRRPSFLVSGEFRKGEDQPVWFSESKLLMDNYGVGIGPPKRNHVGVDTCSTNRKGNVVLWHPDRKFFLLGKEITPEFLADLTVPR